MDLYTIEIMFKKYFESILLLALLLVTIGFSMPASAYDQPWNGNREDITSAENDDEETCSSGNCGCDGTGSPVYLADGSLVWRDTDITFPTSTRVGLKRTYNSFDYRAGLFGRGWVTAQESNIARTYKALDQGNADGSPSTATNFGSVPIWLASYGRRYVLQETATTCTPPGVLYFTFEKQANGNFKQVFEDNQSYSIYDANGKLIQSYSDKDGTSIYYVYDQQNRLTQQYDSYGFTLNFAYSEQGFVSQVTDQGARIWTYTYDEFGRLAQVLDPDSNTKDYSYQLIDNIGYKKHFLNSINDNGIDPVLSVTWANRTIGSSTRMRVASYMESDGKRHDYTYSSTTYNGVPAIRVIKDTKQVGSNTTIERKTYIADTATYHLLSVVNNTDNTSVATVYDNRGKIASRTDKRGNITQYEYNIAGSPSKIIELAGTPNAKEINFTYWNNTDRVAVKSEYGLRETRYTYDTNLRVLTKTLVDVGRGKQRVTTYTYHPNTSDSKGNLILGEIQSIDGSQIGSQDITSIEYNAQGLKTRINYPENQSIRYTYNSVGQPLTTTNINGVVSELSYDSKNRLVQIRKNGRVLQRRYNSQGLLEQSTDQLGRVTSFVYNAQKQPTQVTYPSGDYVTLTYNYTVANTEITRRYYQSDKTLISTRSVRHDAISNNPLSEFLSSSSLQVRLLQYNQLNELTQKTLYGQFGTNTTSVSNYQYNSEGFLSQFRNSLGGITTFEYDDIGQLSKVTDPNNAVTQYTNTVWGELLQMTSPDTGTTTYQINPAGNIDSQVSASNQQVIYSYDARNRVTQIDHDGVSLDVQLTYDQGLYGVGHLTSVIDGSGNTQQVYDEYGLLTQVNASVAGTSLNIIYSYNEVNVLTNITYPSGSQLIYNYDLSGRLSGIQLTENASTQDIVTNINWRGTNISNYQHGNALLTEYNYDTAGRLISKQFGSTNNRFQNQLDNQGNITQQILSQNGIQSSNDFEYDRLGRLIKDTNAILSLGLTYGYDSVGNRQSKQESTSGNSFTYTYEPNTNRLSQINNVPIQRDAVGNRLADGVRQFQYNAMNRVSQINNQQSNIQAVYTYNYLGQRVRKQVSGTQIDDRRYAYDSGGRLLGEYDSLGRRIKEYVYLNSNDSIQLVAQIEPDGTIIYIHTDHLGTPRLASRQDQTIVWRWNSDAFGEQAANEDPDTDGQIITVNLRFPGQYYDSESGLHYNYYRDYDPSIGRYVQSDPVGLAGGLNTYGYVLLNPNKYVDPTGRNTIAMGAGIGSFAGPVGTVVGAVIGLGIGIGIYLLLPDDWAGDDGLTDDEKEFCRGERRACAKQCEEAMDDPDQCNVYGGSISKCIRGCLPQLCGGNKI